MPKVTREDIPNWFQKKTGFDVDIEELKKAAELDRIACADEPMKLMRDLWGITPRDSSWRNAPRCTKGGAACPAEGWQRFLRNQKTRMQIVNTRLASSFLSLHYISMMMGRIIGRRRVLSKR